MIDHIRAHLPLYALIGFWVWCTNYAGPMIYPLLPLSVFLLRARDSYQEIFFGFLMILVLSDIDYVFWEMRKIKTAKHGMMVALSLVMLLDRKKMAPLAGVFPIFLPFFVYALFPLMNSSLVIPGLERTISYALLFLVVPNYVLYNFRLHGWEFIRNLIFFILIMHLSSLVLLWFHPGWITMAGRYRSWFGNPNGLGIFFFLTFILVTTALHLKKDLFTFLEKILVYGTILYFLVRCGSRTSMTATVMFVLFSRLFSFSPFIGFVGFIAFLGIVELVSSNLAAIVIALSLEEFFRLETLDDGSGRYFAWSFAWEHINSGGYFLFGGGFGNDEYVMRQNYPYLRSMGHHGGVHNSYLTLWFNVGILGVLLYFRSFFLAFLKASRRVSIAFAIMCSCMFSIIYESWLTGSLNPFTILLLVIMTIVTEDEIAGWRSYLPEVETSGEQEQRPVPVLAADQGPPGLQQAGA